MATPLLTTASTLQCTHAASVSAVSANTRVQFNGEMAVVLSDTFTVSGCPFQIPIGAGTKPSPCIKVQFLVPAMRVRVGGQPALLQSSSGLCLSAEQIPQGPPNVVQVQPRVKGI
jgi:hypothetical protein